MTDRYFKLGDTVIEERYIGAGSLHRWRPVVVIDPATITGPDETGEDGDPSTEIANCLRRLAEGDHPGSYRRRVAERLAEVFDPKPAEPIGLGAVVEDAEGRRYVRVDSSVLPWVTSEDDAIDYADLDVIKVLSAGVES